MTQRDLAHLDLVNSIAPLASTTPPSCKLEGVAWPTAKHWMMGPKALLFSDEESLNGPCVAGAAGEPGGGTLWPIRFWARRIRGRR